MGAVEHLLLGDDRSQLGTQPSVQTGPSAGGGSAPMAGQASAIRELRLSSITAKVAAAVALRAARRAFRAIGWHGFVAEMRQRARDVHAQRRTQAAAAKTPIL